MAKITKTRTGEYLKESLRILKEKGGECPSGELIKEMANRFTLSDYEKSLNKTGKYRWITQFRFYSIGLVKAGLIKKERGLWILSKKNYDFESKSPKEILD